MPCRQIARLAVMVGAALTVVAAGRVQAGAPYHGQHGLGRHGHFHQRFHRARASLHHRLSYARARHYGHGVRRHHGLGHGGYGYWTGVKRYHGLGDGSCSPSRYWHPVSPYVVVPYPYDGGYARSERASPPDYQRTSEPPVFEVVAVGGADAAPAQRPPSRADRAWDLLGRGDAKSALREFAVLALRSPPRAEPKVGYGLAAAMLGKHETAEWAMRRAVDTNAEALHDLALDDRLTEPVKRLLGHYAELVRGSGVEPGRNVDSLAANN
jgi:hypothetical protein